MASEQIRPCRADENPRLLHIINVAATRYRGVIPDDRWHDPYMSADELTREIDSGVKFLGQERDGELVGVMGVQSVKHVELIRHAYVVPSEQGRGVGGRLLEFLCARSARPMLVGTWAAAVWAIRFYEQHGFALVGRAEVPQLLRAFWSIPERQIETSVVLTKGYTL